MKRRVAAAIVATAAAFALVPAMAQKNAPGISDTEIRIGQTFAYSGPVSSFSAIPKAELAYFKMVNERGGVNGRKINLISVDDGYQPSRALEQTRKLVEQEGVAFIYGSLGTGLNMALRPYLNGRKVPHLFIASPLVEFGDPAKFPWTMGWQATNELDGVATGRYILQNKPDAKIGILYQNDDFGKGFIRGVRNALGDKADRMIVAQASYETTDATIDSQITTLRAAGADTFINIAIPKFAAQAIRIAHDSGWKPLQFLTYSSNSISLTLKPAGLDKSTGILSTQFYKDPTDPDWDKDPGMAEWRAWQKKYYPDADPADANIVFGYTRAQTLVHVLKQCGDDLSRENIMRQAANIKNLELPLLFPGIRLNTSPTNFHPVQQLQMRRFDGTRWQSVGSLMKAA
ncbi:ABC transporter substrate-binding protein [Ramlibacter tataouinensis]|uniref:ABC transporter substrate-binding protein n=1 Tax=Ramlibacter tataouinensis TaxID=94132 RepID=UPI0022F3DA08|nr:ABC transporter substrate-binding protein [Ramlibacter tataouinensis]WBY03079.1 ABC transporter substrate-binding protein [Ramlibacter tataouinensis]